MRLTYDDNLDEILAISRRAGALYARFGGDREEGAAEAVVLIIGYDIPPHLTAEHRFNYLARRAAGEMIRKYQKSHGLTLKNPPVLMSLDDVTAEIVAPVSAIEQEETTAAAAIDRALDWLTVAEVLAEMNIRDAVIIQAWLSGYKQREIARAYQLTPPRVSQIITDFKARARALRNE